jgi:hypothetical protein
MHAAFKLLTSTTLALGVVAVASSQAPDLSSAYHWLADGSALALDYAWRPDSAGLSSLAVTGSTTLGRSTDAGRVFTLSTTVGRITSGSATGAVLGAQLAVMSLLEGGLAYSNTAGVTRIHVPAGVVLPIGGCFLKPVAAVWWGGLRFDGERLSQPIRGTTTTYRIAYAAGLNVELRNGVGVQVMGDAHGPPGTREWAVSLGVHVATKGFIKYFEDRNSRGQYHERLEYSCHLLGGSPA